MPGYAAPYQPSRQPEPERHVEAERPGELVGIDCFYVGRLAGTEGAVWQLTESDVCSSYAWAELVSCPRGNPSGEQTSKLACRVAAELQAAGWRPAFARYLHVRLTGRKRDLAHYLHEYNFDRVHHGRLTRGRIPPRSSTVPAS